jgi:subtilisin
MIRVGHDNARRSALAALGCLLALVTAPALAQGPPARVIPGRYIVVLKDQAADPRGVAAQMVRAHGAAFDNVYDVALKGFAGTIPPGRVAAIQADPRVAYVEPDQVAEVQGKLEVLGKPGGGGGGGGTGQVVPTGVRRIYGTALIPSVVSVNVAVIDTGIQSTHPDLNVIGGVDFTGNRNGFEDGNGHGTHVSGTIAAKNNTIGVVGVAPGAGLYAVKVLNDQGSGQYSWVIAGINWVAANANAGAKNIRVANMSLGGGSSQAVLDALDGAVASGVVFSVAAGNSSADCRGTSPANSTNLGVITVSALCDSDGLPGGLGAATSYGADDTFASFSNNGRNETVFPDPTGNGVDVIAPGVNIYSTYKGSGYATMSGTSMASPHAAGVAALFVASQPASTPADVKLALLESPGTSGSGWNSYIYLDNLTYYFGLLPWRAISGDLDSVGQVEGYEPLVNAGAFPLP